MPWYVDCNMEFPPLPASQARPTVDWEMQCPDIKGVAGCREKAWTPPGVQGLWPVAWIPALPNLRGLRNERKGEGRGYAGTRFSAIPVPRNTGTQLTNSILAAFLLTMQVIV